VGVEDQRAEIDEHLRELGDELDAGAIDQGMVRVTEEPLHRRPDRPGYDGGSRKEERCVEQRSGQAGRIERASHAREAGM